MIEILHLVRIGGRYNIKVDACFFHGSGQFFMWSHRSTPFQTLYIIALCKNLSPPKMNGSRFHKGKQKPRFLGKRGFSVLLFDYISIPMPMPGAIGGIGASGFLISTTAPSVVRIIAATLPAFSRADLVTPLWTNRPDAHRTDAFLVKKGNYARTAKEKLSALRKDLAKTGATATIIGALEDIGWVLNLRARDVRCNPVFTSYLFVDGGRAVLFAAEEHIPEDVHAALREAGVETMPYDAVYDFMDKITDTVYLDPDRSSTRMRMHIRGDVVPS